MAKHRTAEHLFLRTPSSKLCTVRGPHSSAGPTAPRPAQGRASVAWKIRVASSSWMRHFCSSTSWREGTNATKLSAGVYGCGKDVREEIERSMMDGSARYHLLYIDVSLFVILEHRFESTKDKRQFMIGKPWMRAPSWAKSKSKVLN